MTNKTKPPKPVKWTMQDRREMYQYVAAWMVGRLDDQGIELISNKTIEDFIAFVYAVTPITKKKARRK